ncbi:efflux transporter outer membrane subunit [Tamlana agarivorans]|uniref:Efflux transporter outer membrane subunit n=1 Tax=Pseudotamlana agarivorans TaxID=481183 RepID=A0ACC5U5Y3_9FLAO|nr:efflux transporter outer membrane subunit [Tamlana agarivorans]MBU2949723.1 efflux transporter outer membrane subunit [Tamlana agarivorans]
MMKIRKSQISFIVVILLCIVAFNACKVGPNFKANRNKIDSVAVYRYDSLKLATQDSVLNISWWKLFNDPVLDTLIKIGLAENKDVLIASSRIEQAAAQLGFNNADLWPKFGYSAGATRGNVIGGQATPGLATSNMFTGFGTLNWELDFWGKYRRSSEAARAELVASEYGQRTVQIGLISAIVGTHYLLLDYKWREYISRKTLELRQESENIIQARYDYGIVPEIDLNQAQIQRAIAASAVPLYQRQVAQTEHALSVLLGRSPGPIHTGVKLEDQQLPPDIPVGLPSLLMERRPDVLQAEALLHAQTANVGVAVAQRFPAINLTGLFGAVSSDVSTLNLNPAAFAIGGSLLGPLFEFGKNKRRVEIQRRKTEQVMYEYERTVITAFQEVEDALVEISTLKDQRLARQDHVNAAKNALRLSRERYDKGVTSFLELIESQRQAFDAELSLSETTQQLFNGYVKLYKALGGGWLSEQEQNDATLQN